MDLHFADEVTSQGVGCLSLSRRSVVMDRRYGRPSSLVCRPARDSITIIHDGERIGYSRVVAWRSYSIRGDVNMR